MNESRPQDSEIERLLARAHLLEASSQLHDRVTAAARQAWNREPADVPWREPVRRLVLSAAAAVIVISLANHLGNLAGPQVQPEDPAAASVSNSDLEELTEMVYGPSRNRLATSRRRYSRINSVILRDRMEAVRSMLDELERRTVETQPAPSGGASRMLRSQPHSGLYS